MSIGVSKTSEVSLSERILSLEASATLAMAVKARELRQQGKGYYWFEPWGT